MARLREREMLKVRLREANGTEIDICERREKSRIKKDSKLYSIYALVDVAHANFF